MNRFAKTLVGGPLLTGAVVMVLVFLALLSADAQEGTPDWIIGKWKGTQGKGTWSHPTEFTFVREGERVRWTMYRRSDKHSDFWEAAGIVVKSTGEALELEGKYTGGTHAYRWMGGILRFWLSGSADSLSGTAQGADGTVWNVSLERTK